MVFMPGTYRRTREDAGRIIAALEAKLAEYPGDEDLANGECWLSSTAIVALIRHMGSPSVLAIAGGVAR